MYWQIVHNIWKVCHSNLGAKYNCLSNIATSLYNYVLKTLKPW